MLYYLVPCGSQLQLIYNAFLPIFLKNVIEPATFLYSSLFFLKFT